MNDSTPSFASMTFKLKNLVAWRDMLLALDDEGNLWRLTIDQVTNKATATLIPVKETKE